jgi:hypothetical protein
MAATERMSMPRTSSRKTSKRQHASASSTRTATVAPRRTTATKHKALRAAKVDPVLTQELLGARVSTATPTAFLSAVELLGFMARAASTSLTLPLAMMRCRTPFEMWDEQNKFVQGVFADLQKVSARVICSAFYGAAEEARDPKVKKRRRTVAS